MDGEKIQGEGEILRLLLMDTNLPENNTPLKSEMKIHAIGNRCFGKVRLTVSAVDRITRYIFLSRG